MMVTTVTTSNGGNNLFIIPDYHLPRWCQESAKETCYEGGSPEPSTCMPETSAITWSTIDNANGNSAAMAWDERGGMLLPPAGGVSPTGGTLLLTCWMNNGKGFPPISI
jgi:hypothetical protein